MDSADSNRSRVTLIYDTGEREDDALLRMQWVLPLSFLGASLILFFAVMEWFAPMTPVLLFVFCLWLPVSLFLLWRRRARLQSGVFRAVAVLALFGLPLLAWASSPYRLAVLWMVGDIIPVESLLAASDDVSDDVAVRACEQVVSTTSSATIQRVGEIALARPTVARRCLTDLEDRHRGPLVRLVRDVRREWHARWMDEDAFHRQEAICEETLAYSELALAFESAWKSPMMICALQAPTVEASRCCGEVLSENTEAEQRSSVPLVAVDDELKESLFFALASSVDLPAEAVLSEEPVVESLDWSAGQLFHWTTILGCDLMGLHDRPEVIAHRLSTTINTQCGLEISEPQFSFAAVRFVDRTCDAVAAPTGDGLIDIVQWCEAARVANRQTVVESARVLVERALWAHGLDELDHSIRHGSHWAHRQAHNQPIVSVQELSDLRTDVDIGTDGVHLGRPDWADHRPDSKRRLTAMEQERRERRDGLQGRVDDTSAAEINRQVSSEIRKELRQMRRAREAEPE